MRRRWLAVVLALVVGVGLVTPEAQGRFWVLVNGALRYTGTVVVIGPMTISLGNAPSALARVGGVLNSQFTPVSNVTTGETDLMTWPLPANALSANGKGVRIFGWGTTAANANGKTISLYVGGVVISTRVNTANNATWYVSGIVLRTGAATEVTFGDAEIGGTHVPAAVALTFDTTAACTIKVTGQSAVATADITQVGLIVEALP